VDHDPAPARRLPHRLHNFDPEKIARFDAKEIAALMNNPGIIRNRARIEGTVASARA
jgi:DNA-3-methyladenine glycosylase I